MTTVSAAWLELELEPAYPARHRAAGRAHRRLRVLALLRRPRPTAPQLRPWTGHPRHS